MELLRYIVMKIIAKPGADTPSGCVPFLPVFPYMNTLTCLKMNVMMLILFMNVSLLMIIVSLQE